MAEACAPYPFFHAPFQASPRAKGDRGRARSAQSPLPQVAAMFFSASQWLFEHFRQAKHTNIQTNTQTASAPPR